MSVQRKRLLHHTHTLTPEWCPQGSGSDKAKLISCVGPLSGGPNWSELKDEGGGIQDGCCRFFTFNPEKYASTCSYLTLKTK